MRTPKGMRMAIGLFGRRNVGKSSVLNAITNQQTSIVSAVAGTTADPVDKPMELLPLGPVLFIDTAGIDDDQETVGELRTQRTKKVFDRCDMAAIVTEAGTWGAYEDEIAAQLSSRSIPFIIVCNKTDLLPTNARGPESRPHRTQPESAHHGGPSSTSNKKRLPQHAAAPFPIAFSRNPWFVCARQSKKGCLSCVKHCSTTRPRNS